MKGEPIVINRAEIQTYREISDEENLIILFPLAAKIKPSTACFFFIGGGGSVENHQNDEFRPQWKRVQKTVSDLY